jgi:hypothetical protein
MRASAEATTPPDRTRLPSWRHTVAHAGGRARRASPFVSRRPARGRSRSTASARAQPVTAAKKLRASLLGVARASFTRKGERSVAPASACRAGRARPRASSPRCRTALAAIDPGTTEPVGRRAPSHRRDSPREMHACRATQVSHRSGVETWSRNLRVFGFDRPPGFRVPCIRESAVLHAGASDDRRADDSAGLENGEERVSHARGGRVPAVVPAGACPGRRSTCSAGEPVLSVPPTLWPTGVGDGYLNAAPFRAYRWSPLDAVRTRWVAGL